MSADANTRNLNLVVDGEVLRRPIDNRLASSAMEALLANADLDPRV